MALFGSARDASLVRSINRELIYDFIDTEIAFYKLSLDDTKANMYDEADNKVYYAPMRFNALVQKDEKTVIGDEYGMEYTRTGIFGFGQSIAITCQAHVTRRNRLNIQEVRSGINKPGSVIPKNL
jgi:hypothetical protein